MEIRRYKYWITSPDCLRTHGEPLRVGAYSDCRMLILFSGNMNVILISSSRISDMNHNRRNPTSLHLFCFIIHGIILRESHLLCALLQFSNREVYLHLKVVQHWTRASSTLLTLLGSTGVHTHTYISICVSMWSLCSAIVFFILILELPLMSPCRVSWCCLVFIL